MFINNHLLENKFDRCKLVEMKRGDQKRRSNLSMEALDFPPSSPNFLPSSPLSAVAIECIPAWAEVEKEVKKVKASLSVKAQEFVPAKERLPLINYQPANTERVFGEKEEELEDEILRQLKEKLEETEVELKQFRGGRKTRCQLSTEAREFLPSSPLSVEAREFFPVWAEVKVEEVEEDGERVKASLSVKAGDFVPARERLSVKTWEFVNTKGIMEKKEEENQLEDKLKSELEDYTKKKVEDELEKLLEELEDKLEDEMEDDSKVKVVEQLVQFLKGLEDRLGEKLEDELEDDIKEKAEDQLEQFLKELEDKLEDKTEDDSKEKVEEQLEELLKELEEKLENRLEDELEDDSKEKDEDALEQFLKKLELKKRHQKDQMSYHFPDDPDAFVMPSGPQKGKRMPLIFEVFTLS